MTAQSPFIEGTNIQWAWDSTSLGWLKTCPRLYQYYMIEGWIPSEDRIHLTFGIWYHSSLEAYDKAIVEGKDHEEALDIALDTALKLSFIEIEHEGQKVRRPWRSDHNTKTRETLIRSVIWYCDHFKNHPVETIKLANGKAAVELSFRMNLGVESSNGVEYVLCGHLDRLALWNGGAYVLDRKTTGTTLSTYYFNRYDPDNQMSCYNVAAKVVYNVPAQGVIIDAAQIAVGFTRFGRGMVTRSELQMQEWLRDLRWWMLQAENYAKANYWPMNDTACDKFGGCTFRGICSKSPDVRKTFLEGNFVKRQWNPLESR